MTDYELYMSDKIYEEKKLEELEMKNEKKTLGSWAIEQNIRLLDTKYYEDTNLYTIEEYEKMVPRNIEVPLYNNIQSEADFSNDEIVKVENNEIIVSKEIINKIIEFNRLKKEMEYQEKLLKDGLMEAMNSVGLKKFFINGLSAVIKDGTTRTTIDSKRLKEECPDIYEAYSKTSEVKPSLTLTVEE